MTFVLRVPRLIILHPNHGAPGLSTAGYITMLPKTVFMPSGGLFHLCLRLRNVMAPEYVVHHTDAIHRCVLHSYVFRQSSTRTRPT